MNNLSKEATRLLNAAPVEYAAIVEKMTAEQLQSVEREVDGLAQKAAEIGGYLGSRGAAGMGHAEASTSAAKRVKRVRKALGYTLP